MDFKNKNLETKHIKILKFFFSLKINFYKRRYTNIYHFCGKKENFYIIHGPNKEVNIFFFFLFS